jgi:hypothetical protein
MSLPHSFLAGKGGGVVVMPLGYIAQIEGTYNAGLRYFTKGAGDILWAEPRSATEKYIIETNFNGTTINAEVAYDGGSSSYEEFDSRSASFDQSTNYAFMPIMDANKAGAVRIDGSSGFTSSSGQSRYKQNSANLQYGAGGCYWLGSVGASSEQVVITGFGPGGGTNQSTAYFAYWNPNSASNNFRTYKIWPSGSNRNYTYTGARSAYSNKMSVMAIGNNPSQYRKHTSFWTASADTDISGFTGKYNNTVNCYSKGMGWAGSRWLQSFTDNDNSVSCLISWDYNAFVKGQLVLKDSIIANNYVDIVCFAYTPASVGGDSSDNDVYMLIKDPASSRPRTYYYVLWSKDDNNNSSTGGSGNSGGTWNKGQNAKRIVLNSANGGNGSSGSREGSFSTQNGINYILMSAQIGPGNNDVIFQVPIDMNLIIDGSYDWVTIDSGAEVNTIVNAYQQQSLGTSFSADSWSYEKQSTAGTSIGTTASTFTSNAAFSNIKNI